MTWEVLLTDSAAHDLNDICDYIFVHDGPERADQVLDGIEKAFSSLSVSPQRGSYPDELLALGNQDYRQIYFKPYRIIYRVVEKRVYVMAIVDGRRDLHLLLQRRLLED